jgi:hypothetical protein
MVAAIGIILLAKGLGAGASAGDLPSGGVVGGVWGSNVCGEFFAM